MSGRGVWLGVDYGEARLGLARSDPSGRVATPVGVHRSQGMGEDVRYVAQMAKDSGATGIVVGLPQRLDGSASAATLGAADFARRLKEACELPVVTWDERFSTVEADKALREGGLSRRERAERADKVAAALILQAYLDRQGNSGKGERDAVAPCETEEPVELPGGEAQPAAAGPALGSGTARRRLPLKATGLAVVVGTLVFLGISASWVLSAPGGERGQVSFRVPTNATAALVASGLKEEGLIRSALVFSLLSRLKGVDQDFKAGVHVLDRSLSTLEIMSSLVAGDRRLGEIIVTIPEGYSLLQIGDTLERNGVTPAGDFLAAAEGKRVAAGVVSFPLPEGSLEGYLFPDTYYFEPDSRPEAVVARMLVTFDKRVSGAISGHKMLPSPLRSFREALILASLVEREAKLPEERPLIAGVYLNRLRRGMRLECDATVQYALGQHKARLLYSDLKVDSPYNTYLHAGLPPGPICSPGLDCILAALSPVESDYLYYVAQVDGSHVFSRTFAEHKAAGG